ncbi:electron transport complex subunit RsxC [Desulfonema magnum]|uniref:Ion-translocating oxidoreductase complex subunit C n=1 Tax=Desulfonema magnum TaxID=45655 RepID=A0A975GN70_9BACT|nr:electron transport complex subunit RsxC [Desulfonema magnum]QTA87465.1 Ion-translocating oxidoreductase complex, subunit C [Desulfonema magnum]
MELNTLATFPKGGVHPGELKEFTAGLPVETMTMPSRVSLFLKQHVGASCEVSVEKRHDKPPDEALLFHRHPGRIYQLLVDKKDRVKTGDMIGSVGEKLGANLHASLSGTVQGIADVLHPAAGKSPAIVISGDPEASAATYSPTDWHRFSRQELFDRIRNAGIVGLGGAGFPADIKLNVNPDVQLDTLILNGAECEPYLTCDHRVMVEHAREVVEGAKILLTILGISDCAIGIENNKPDAIECLQEIIRQEGSENGFRIRVSPLQVKYPQGSADQIMQSITGRVRPSGKRSSSIGIIVQNVYTAKTVYDAVVLGKPFYERVITVSGKGIARPANLLVPIGTHLSDIVSYLGGTTPDLAKVIMGGPMMGPAVSSLDIPITKTTSGVLFLTKDEIDTQPYGPCIRCGFCLDACPMGLEPNNIGIWVEAGRGAETEEFGLMDDCFECGSCAYVCPAKRPLVQFIRLARIQVSEARKKKN